MSGCQYPILERKTVNEWTRLGAVADFGEKITLVELGRNKIAVAWMQRNSPYPSKLVLKQGRFTVALLAQGITNAW